jgi:hypothetical protein
MFVLILLLLQEVMGTKDQGLPAAGQYQKKTPTRSEVCPRGYSSVTSVRERNGL